MPNPNPAITKAAEEIVPPAFVTGDYDAADRLSAAERSRQREVARVAAILTRHFAPAAATDEGEVTYDEVEAMFADEAVTVSQRNGQVGVCVDHWIPIRTKGDAKQLLTVLTALGIVPRE